MKTIKINNISFPVINYIHYIGYYPKAFNTGNCSIVSNNLDIVKRLVQETITSIQIYIDNKLIYNFDTEAQITGIQQSLEEDRMVVNIMFSFQTLDN